MGLTIYEKNLTKLMEYYPDIAAQVNQCNDGFYVLDPSDDRDRPNLIYIPQSEEDDPISFYDFRNPIQHARDVFAGYAHEKAHFVVLLGIGLGYCLNELSANQQTKKLAIVEQDPACFKKAMEASDLTDIIGNPAIDLVVGCPEDQLFVTLNRIVESYPFALKGMRFIPWPASIIIAESYYSRVVDILSDATNIWLAERGNDPFDTLVGYEHFFKNIKYYMENPGADYMKDFFEGKPAIVVATGPSLTKNIDLLKNTAESAVILSADSSLRILLKHDIFPHFVTTVERTPGFDKQFRDLKNYDKTVFAAVSFVHPSTLEAWKGRFIFFHRFYNFMERLGVAEDSIDMGMSTANMAFSIAHHMGCDPIILVGNDLAYDSSGNTHAKGFLYGERQECYEDENHIEVPGNYEETVKTNLDWYKCIKSYERRHEKWGGTLINATAGGARIAGSEVIGLKEVVQSYCTSPFNPRESIAAHLSKWQSSRTIESILSPLRYFIKEIDPVIDTCKKMVDILEPMLRAIEVSGDRLSHVLFTKMQESVPHVGSAMNAMTTLELIGSFGEYFHSEIIPLLMEWQVICDRFESPEWATAYRIKLAEDFFKTIGQLCISLKPILEEGERHLMELMAAPEEVISSLFT